jgi:hypothetical protein
LPNNTADNNGETESEAENTKEMTSPWTRHAHDFSPPTQQGTCGRFEVKAIQFRAAQRGLMSALHPLRTLAVPACPQLTVLNIRSTQLIW